MVAILGKNELERLHPGLQDPIEYRKSGLSLNHVIGCPLDCAYCVRHLFENFEMKQPRLLMSDEEAVDRLLSHAWFQPHRTPLQVFNRATDALLPSVKPHTFRVLELLDSHGLTNHVLVISRWKLNVEDCLRFNQLRHIRLTLLFTWSGIVDPRVEPVDSEVAAISLRLAADQAGSYRVVLYWRPLIPGVNDTEDHLSRALALARHAHATAYSGLFFRDEIRAHYRAASLPEPYSASARRKILPEQLESRILEARLRLAPHVPLFRKTSCAVAYAHGLPDYNGHYGIREICDICPKSQVGRCQQAFRRPAEAEVYSLCDRLGIEARPVLTNRAIEIQGLDEQRRYFIQHALGYQVHNPLHPHRHRRHGRAEVGWEHVEDD